MFYVAKVYAIAETNGTWLTIQLSNGTVMFAICSLLPLCCGCYCHFTSTVSFLITD